MTVDVFSHEIEQELSISFAQEVEDRPRVDIPSGWINEGKCETVSAGSSDAVQMILEFPVKDSDIEIALRFCVPTKLFCRRLTPLAKTEPDSETRSAYFFQAIPHLMEDT